ncbi:lytic murein transglycosylase [Lichenihabitans psoromatis]|uniref:lytic murein transglycosylase n=1 Tax=Lichenihabitans psoromatis TaxID=2528642 RepID=UPI001035D426|nr:lytic murein transglycosylase [Lichenihabitans psoromatis]
MRLFKRLLPIVGLTFSLAAGSTAYAASCSDPAGFPAWLESYKSEAAAAGISQGTIDAALGNVTYDRETISHDRGQKVFKQSFEQFSARMANAYRISKGKSLIKRYADVFSRIESQYGVPAPVIVAIWGLETDFGAFMGKFETIRSLATLAYDCRRPDKFRAELTDALRIVQRGDMSPSSMRGAWAGEIGQTQFMPSSYIKYAVDFDGSGRRDLVHSVPDVLASTAKYLQGYGWQAGAGWDPGEANFAVIQQWNASAVYSRTIALLADKIAGTK